MSIQLKRQQFTQDYRQSPDFYGILASRMVGRFGRKVGRSGKKESHFLTCIYRLGEEMFLKEVEINLPITCFSPQIFIASLRNLLTLSYPFFFFLI